jgi:hypothetical protein
MKKLLLIVLLPVISISLSFAQDNKKDFGQQMYESIKAERISFLAPKLNLTPAEAQTFWPVYNEYEKKRWDIQGKRLNFERMRSNNLASQTDEELGEITKSYIESFEMEGDLRKEYHKKFTQILSLRKLVQLYKAENDFKEFLLKKYSPKWGPGRH